MEEPVPPSETTLCTSDENAPEVAALSTAYSALLSDSGNQQDSGNGKQEEATKNSGKAIDWEWGIPLFLEEDDDSEDLEEWPTNRNEGDDLSEDLEKTSANEAIPDHEATDPITQQEASQKDPKDSFDPSLKVRCAAIEVDYPISPVASNRSNEYYYKKLHLDRQRQRSSPRSVTLNYNAVTKQWQNAIDFAIAEIQKFVPGLLFEKNQSLTANIYLRMVANGGCYTVGSLRKARRATDAIKSESLISLTDNWDPLRLNSTAIHEILHALGFEHEHQRCDAGHYLTVFKKSKKDSQIIPDAYIKPLTPFDKYSIILYRIGKRFELSVEQNQQYPENRHLSELDKIALNMIYPPCCRELFYTPKKANNGLYYCERSDVMENHNQPAQPLTATCGPTSGPNCPACRVLSKPHLGDKWQGRSGFVYCGKKKCGPNVDPPCRECGDILNYYY